MFNMTTTVLLKIMYEILKSQYSMLTHSHPVCLVPGYLHHSAPHCSTCSWK